MTALLKWWAKDGVKGQCNAHCYDGDPTTAVTCTCLCGGACHGKGKDTALMNIKAFAVKWMAEHPEVTSWTTVKQVTFRNPAWGAEDPRYFRSPNKNERYWKKHANYIGPQGHLEASKESQGSDNEHSAAD